MWVCVSERRGRGAVDGVGRVTWQWHSSLCCLPQVIGTGVHGRVKLALHRSKRHFYAVKVFNKAVTAAKNRLKYLQNEKFALSSVGLWLFEAQLRRVCVYVCICVCECEYV